MSSFPRLHLHLSLYALAAECFPSPEGTRTRSSPDSDSTPPNTFGTNPDLIVILPSVSDLVEKVPEYLKKKLNFFLIKTENHSDKNIRMGSVRGAQTFAHLMYCTSRPLQISGCSSRLCVWGFFFGVNILYVCLFIYLFVIETLLVSRLFADRWNFWFLFFIYVFITRRFPLRSVVTRHPVLLSPQRIGTDAPYTLQGSSPCSRVSHHHHHLHPPQSNLALTLITRTVTRCSFVL